MKYIKRILLVILGYALLGALLGAGSALLRHFFHINISPAIYAIISGVVVFIVVLALEFTKGNRRR